MKKSNFEIYKEINKLEELYSKNVNIINYIKNNYKLKDDYRKAILVSYDLQTGSYIKNTEKNKKFINLYTKAIAKIINRITGNTEYSLMEAGIGEATTLGNLVPKLETKPISIYGFDISWSRVFFGNQYLKYKKVYNANLFTADLFKIPLKDNSIDIVYTSHSIEPNGGKEKEALEELYRITNKYLILLEPSYEFADKKGKARMGKFGYVKNLKQTAKKLKFNVMEHRLFDYYANKTNPTGLMIIEKNKNSKPVLKANNFICPITKYNMVKKKNIFYSPEGKLTYPIIEGIPCLLSQNAILTTKMGKKLNIL